MTIERCADKKTAVDLISVQNDAMVDELISVKQAFEELAKESE